MAGYNHPRGGALGPQRQPQIDKATSDLRLDWKSLQRKGLGPLFRKFADLRLDKTKPSKARIWRIGVTFYQDFQV